MKHRALRFSAWFLAILAGLMALSGLIVTVIVGMSMKSLISTIAVILVGFILTAISAIILVAVSQLMLLFVRIEEELVMLAAAVKSKTGD